MNKQITLTCKRVIFYCMKDEDAFFGWIGKISCIDKFWGRGDELYLEIKSKKISNQDLDDLIGLFHRYKIDMKQLAQFLNAKNKSWFFDNKKAFWWKKTFQTDSQKPIKKS